MTLHNKSWRATYAIGEPTLDAQHRHLFDLADVLLRAADRDQATAGAMQLYQYVRTHFKDEEDLMRRVDFPGYKDHVSLHEALIERLNRISADIAADCWQPRQLRAFMNDWLLGHIAQCDTQIAQHLRHSADQGDPAA